MGRQNNTINASGWRAAIKQWRRNNRRWLNGLLTRLFGTAEPRRRALAADTRRVLVVRLNKRLGNILFLTPLLRTLTASLPCATVDVLIQDARQKPLLESLPGIGRIWVQEKNLASTLRLIRELRRRRYDLAIDPTRDSTGNRLAVAVSGARRRMGFAGENQWLRLTHAAPRRRSRHQARQALELLTDSVDGLVIENFETVAVFPAEHAQTLARRAWAQAIDERQRRGPVIGFFAQATGNKQLPAHWWQAWQKALEELAPDATLLQIRPPGQATPLLANTASVEVPQLDVLAALMTRMDVFVAADSGPMHLAAAAGVPVVGLFRATAPGAYAPLGRDCASLTGSDLTVEHAARAVARLLAERL